MAISTDYDPDAGPIKPVSPMEALYTALGDLFTALGGVLMVRTTASYTPGDTVLTVEGTYDFPDSGTIYFEGKKLTYTGRTATSFTGLSGDLPDETVKPYAVVTDWNRSFSEIDQLRQTMVLASADSEDLAIYGSNHGLNQPRGVTTEQFRSLLQALMWGPTQTIYSLETVLDILLGEGAYTLWEELITDPHTVFISADISVGDEIRTYLIGGEEQSRTSTTTVDTTYDPVLVYGVYADTDPDRSGTNYVMQEYTGASTAAGNPSRLTAGSGVFVAADDRQIVVIVNAAGETLSHWKVTTVVSATEVELAWDAHDDASMAAGGDVIVTDTDWFPEWVVGHRIRIAAGSNAGDYLISEWISPYSVRVTDAAGAPVVLAAQTAATWNLLPEFATASGVRFRMNRATVSGNTITTPVTMPADVLIDYTGVESAQVMLEEDVNGNDRSPFYFFDGTDAARTLLDLITAAGVQVVEMED